MSPADNSGTLLIISGKLSAKGIVGHHAYGVADVVQGFKNQKVDKYGQRRRCWIPEHDEGGHPAQGEDDAQGNGAKQDPGSSFTHAAASTIRPFAHQGVGDDIKDL